MVLGEVRDERLEFLTDTIDVAFAEHHSDNVSIGARAVGQDRGIHHAQPGQAVHTTMRVYHCQRIGHRPHLADTADVVHGGDVA